MTDHRGAINIKCKANEGMISGLSYINTNSCYGSKLAWRRVWREKNHVVLHAVKMACWQVYNIVIKYNCIYLSELWCFRVLDQVNNLAFLLK